MKKNLKRISLSGLGYNAILPALFSMGSLLVLLVLFAVNCVASFARPTDKGVAFAGVNKEIWLPEIKENFYPEGDWLAGVEDFSSFVEFNTLNLADAGIDPTIYVNNTSFPIVPAQRTDAALTIPLATLDSQTTIIRNIEEMESAYDKRGSVIRQHQNALMKKCYDLSAFYFAPQADDVLTPIEATTGADDGNGFKLITMQDLNKMSKRFNSKNIPKAGRVCVLHEDHLQALLNANITLQNQYADLKEGKPMRFAGWDIYSFYNTPVFNKTTRAKTAFGAAPAGTDSPSSSIFFVKTEVGKADGTYDMFTLINDPAQRGDHIGFQKRFWSGAIRNKGIGAIVSVVS